MLSISRATSRRHWLYILHCRIGHGRASMSITTRAIPRYFICDTLIPRKLSSLLPPGHTYTAILFSRLLRWFERGHLRMMLIIARDAMRWMRHFRPRKTRAHAARMKDAISPKGRLPAQRRDESNYGLYEEISTAERVPLARKRAERERARMRRWL